MFVKVLYGDNHVALFNLDCRLVNFMHSLKTRCGLDTEDCVDLMDRWGTVMSLAEREHSAEPASSVLVERSSYVLMRVCRTEDSEGQKYVPLLNNLGKSHPELSDVLRRMSNPSKERERRTGPLRKGWSQKDSPVSQSRSRKHPCK